jgi:hypothetical protein
MTFSRIIIVNHFTKYSILLVHYFIIYWSLSEMFCHELRHDFFPLNNDELIFSSTVFLRIRLD